LFSQKRLSRHLLCRPHGDRTGDHSLSRQNRTAVIFITYKFEACTLNHQGSAERLCFWQNRHHEESRQADIIPHPKCEQQQQDRLSRQHFTSKHQKSIEESSQVTTRSRVAVCFVIEWELTSIKSFFHEVCLLPLLLLLLPLLLSTSANYAKKITFNLRIHHVPQVCV